MRHCIPMRFWGFLIIFLLFSNIFNASALAESSKVLEPKTYSVINVGETKSINGKCFKIWDDIDFFFSELPKTIRSGRKPILGIEKGVERVALSQKIQTKKVSLYKFSHWKQLARWIGITFFALSIFYILGTKNVKVIPLAIFFACLIVYSSRSMDNFVCLDNATNRKYIVYVNDRKFVLPSQSHGMIYLDSNIFHIKVVDIENKQMVDQEAIQVNTGTIIFNINSKNSYFLKRGAYY